MDADLADFETVNFERLTRELEGAANGITEQVFQYWTQNKDLRLEIRVSAADPADEPPLDQGPIVNVRIYNPRHYVSVPFDERSRGFVWFFSFFAYFSNIEQQEGRRTILLLDEPVWLYTPPRRETSCASSTLSSPRPTKSSTPRTRRSW